MCVCWRYAVIVFSDLCQHAAQSCKVHSIVLRSDSYCVQDYSVWFIIIGVILSLVNNGKEWFDYGGDDWCDQVRHLCTVSSVYIGVVVLLLFSAKRSCDPKGYFEWWWVWALPEYSGQTGKRLVTSVCSPPEPLFITKDTWTLKFWNYWIAVMIEVEFRGCDANLNSGGLRVDL